MSKGLSLHLGLNRVDPDHYQGWDGQLSGCVNDAQAMSSIALTQSFSPKQLYNEHATADAVLKGISAAAKALKSGDIFFLSYSGHGGQVPDTTAMSRMGKMKPGCCTTGS